MTGSCRIVYQFVASMEKTLGVAKIDRRRDYLQRYAAAGTEIVVLSVASGYPSIVSERDAVVVAPHLVAGLTTSRIGGGSFGGRHACHDAKRWSDVRPPGYIQESRMDRRHRIVRECRDHRPGAPCAGLSPSALGRHGPTRRQRHGTDRRPGSMQVLDLIVARSRALELGTLLITHDLRIVARYCDRVATCGLAGSSS